MMKESCWADYAIKPLKQKRLKIFKKIIKAETKGDSHDFPGCETAQHLCLVSPKDSSVCFSDFSLAAAK